MTKTPSTSDNRDVRAEMREMAKSMTHINKVFEDFRKELATVVKENKEIKKRKTSDCSSNATKMKNASKS